MFISPNRKLTLRRALALLVVYGVFGAFLFIQG